MFNVKFSKVCISVFCLSCRR